jgi:2-C-methyl-D-erythritol 2,4-cyclodiphosphate synthase
MLAVRGSSERLDTMRVGIGHDTHRLVEGRPLILGGVRIDHARGLMGHSDADVVLHAVADALLGASALGDIGELFPDTDPKWKGLDGGVLLNEVMARVTVAGWKVGNCDVVIHAQEPKLTAHKAAIRANLARLLQVPLTDVNIKAKTGENVGPIGRSEAISAEVIVLLKRTED